MHWRLREPLQAVVQLCAVGTCAVIVLPPEPETTREAQDRTTRGAVMAITPTAP